MKGGLGQSELILVQGLGGRGWGWGIDTVFIMKQGPPPGHCHVTGVGGGGIDTVFSMKQGPPPGNCRVTGVGGGGGGGGYGQCSA